MTCPHLPGGSGFQTPLALLSESLPPISTRVLRAVEDVNVCVCVHVYMSICLCGVSVHGVCERVGVVAVCGGVCGMRVYVYLHGVCVWYDMCGV